ncbi:hypothetical protein EAO69_11520 [Streptomyces sp. me109]|nr:hypothetical protein EAO69_11520 [Streptomyces sp. me109]
MTAAAPPRARRRTPGLQECANRPPASPGGRRPKAAHRRLPPPGEAAPGPRGRVPAVRRRPPRPHGRRRPRRPRRRPPPSWWARPNGRPPTGAGARR